MYLTFGIKTFNNLNDILLSNVLKSYYGCILTIQGYKCHGQWEGSHKNYYHATCVLIFNFEACISASTKAKLAKYNCFAIFPDFW